VQKIILYIQPQLRNTTTTQDFVRVDLMEEDLISLTQVIQDVNDIDKVFTDYSRTFNLPASKTNNKIFKHWYNPDIDGFDNQIFCNARIELNHLHFKLGKIKLEEVVLKNAQPSMYKVTFFGDTLTLTELINEDNIQNLTWLNNFNFTASNATVKDGLENGLNFTVDSVAYNDAIIYPLIAHSQSYIYDNANNQDNGLNIAATGSNLTQRGVSPDDLKPAITAKIIFKAIEQQYGITFKTSEFLDSAAMTNLYLWLHRDKGDILSPNIKLVNNDNFTCYSSIINCNHFTNTNTKPHFNKGSYLFLDTNSFSQPETFIYETEVTPTVSTTSYAIEIYEEISGTVVAIKESLTGNNSLRVGYGAGEINFVAPNTDYKLSTRIRSESTLQFALEINVTHSAWNQAANNNFGAYETYSAEFQSDSATITTSKTIFITNQIPNIKVLDFLRAFLNMHKLTAFLNFKGEVVMKTLNSFYADGETFNITPFVKTDEHTVGATVPFSEIDFEYAEPKSILAQQFLNTNNQKYGKLKYLADTDKSKKYEIKIPFEHMLFERLQDKTSGALTTVQIGSFLDDNLEPSIGQPLLFYGIYQQNQDNINFLDSTRPETYGALCPTGTNTSLDDYWIPSVCSSLGTASTPPTYNLNFGSEINTYTLTDYGGNNNSLFQTYYQNYILRVFNKKTRIFKFSAVLPLKVLLTLTLDDLIVVGTRAYTINKMSTKLQSGETNFELLNEPN